MIYKYATHSPLWLQYNEEKRKSADREAHLSSFSLCVFSAKWSKMDMFSSPSWQVGYRAELRPVNVQRKAVLQGFPRWWSKWLLLALTHTDQLSLRQYSLLLSRKVFFQPPLKIEADKNSSIQSGGFFSNNRAISCQENNAFPLCIILRI